MSILVEIGYANACLAFMVMPRIIRECMTIRKELWLSRSDDLFEDCCFTASLLPNHHMPTPPYYIEVSFMIFKDLQQKLIVVCVGATEIFDLS